MYRVTVGVPAAGRARKHFVPGAKTGQRSIHPDSELLAPGNQILQRIIRQKFIDFGRQCQRGAGHRISGGVTSSRPSAAGHAARDTPVAACSNSAAPAKRSLDNSVFTLVGMQLDNQRMPPGVHRIAPAALTRKFHNPTRSGGELTVKNVGFLTHRHVNQQQLDSSDLGVAAGRALRSWTTLIR
uniref:B1549_C2_200 n=1 Tax=Mycobacterium leprae TaxID=1769 RepID=Q49715_MYCLR|nr:B1549_C2_200 [Mycobacterium leprae]